MRQLEIRSDSFDKIKSNLDLWMSDISRIKKQNVTQGMMNDNLHLEIYTKKITKAETIDVNPGIK